MRTTQKRTRTALTLAVLATIFAGYRVEVAHAATKRVDGWTVIDNSFVNDASGTYTESKGWTNTGDFDKNDWLRNSRYDANTAATGEFAEWKFLNLPNGLYEVAVSYATPNPNRSSAAPYTVVGKGTFFVNQETVAAGTPKLNDGTNDIPFDTITTNVQVTNGTLTVKLNDVANDGKVDYVIADAVAIRLVPEPSTSSSR